MSAIKCNFLGVIYSSPQRVYSTSRTFYSTAYPNYRASFTPTHATFAFPSSYYGWNYQVRIYMYWYNNSGYLQGYSIHDVDSFYVQNRGYELVQTGHCRI